MLPSEEVKRMETYEEMLRERDVLGHGFSYRELVSRWPNRRKAKPPRHLWENIITTMDMANILRKRMVERGASGLRITAAYRPRGGASSSKHKVNAALDLDLLKRDRSLAVIYHDEAARLFSDFAVQHKMGMGFYGWSYKAGLRIHIDTCSRTRPRSWWHHGGRVLRSPVWRLMEELNLPDPEKGVLR
jgi:hypothetical protein